MNEIDENTGGSSAAEQQNRTSMFIILWVPVDASLCTVMYSARVSHGMKTGERATSFSTEHTLTACSVGRDRHRSAMERQRWRRRYWRQGQARTAEATATAAAGVETGAGQCLQISTGLTQEDSEAAMMIYAGMVV